MAVIATGFFDGVHLGHRLVIDILLREARRLSEEAVVITFWPHPRTVLQSDARDFRLLASLEEKKALLLSMGVDRVEVLPFSRRFAAMTAREYLEFLRSMYGATALVLGYDTRFGSDQLGPEAISGLAAALSLPCTTVSAVDSAAGVQGARGYRAHATLGNVRGGTACGGVGAADGVVPPCSLNAAISSTGIRRALMEGDVEAAAAMLGRRYSLHGVVVAGNRLGRTIGFPTANMQLYDPLKLIPGRGVYLVEVNTLGRHFYGMTNIGFRPTVNGQNMTIETNIFDFDEMIYGLDITVSFVRKIRDERKFDSLEDLSAQLAADRESVRDCVL